MPKVTIWIREADYPRWQAVKDIPEFITESLKRKDFSDKFFANAPLQNGRVVKENEDGSKLIHFDRMNENIKINDHVTVSPINKDEPSYYSTDDPTYTDVEESA